MSEINHVFLHRQLELERRDTLANLFNLRDMERAAFGLKQRPSTALKELIEEHYAVLREIEEREYKIHEKAMRDSAAR